MIKHIFFIHWNEAELKKRIAPLKEAGYTVSSHFNTETVAALSSHIQYQNY